MPRALKRRAEAISQDPEDSSGSEEASPPHRSTQAQSQGQRRTRRLSTPAADDSGSEAEQNNVSENEGADAASVAKNMTKKLVRLALSCEYARQPIRRSDINAKILKGGEGTAARPQAGLNFRTIFNSAQATLRSVFGMEMVDLPSRERTGLNDRRKAASQKATQREAQKKSQPQGELDGYADTQGRSRGPDSILSAQNWILVSTLPPQYRTRPELLIPGRAPDQDSESTYVALCTTLVSLLYLHMPSAASSKGTQPQTEDQVEPISDARFMRYLSRLGLRDFTPMGTDNGATLDKTLARMLREGYVEKRRDTSGGEEIVEWIVGPRGKKEIGRNGVAALVRGVYGFGLDGSGNGLELRRANGEASSDDEEVADADDDQRRRPVKMEKADLERRLKRTLGDVVALEINDTASNGVQDAAGGEDTEGPGNSRRRARAAEEPPTTRRSTRRRGNDDDDDAE